MTYDYHDPANVIVTVHGDDYDEAGLGAVQSDFTDEYETWCEWVVNDLWPCLTPEQRHAGHKHAWNRLGFDFIPLNPRGAEKAC